MISNNITNYNIKKDAKYINTVNKEKANSIKFSGYKSMLIAAHSMHNYLKVKLFDSIEHINSYLSDIEIGNDTKLLKHLSNRISNLSDRKELKSIRYWIKLIRSYIMNNNSLKGKLEQFNIFVAFERHIYQVEPLIKLLAFLFGNNELKCLFESYKVVS